MNGKLYPIFKTASLNRKGVMNKKALSVNSSNKFLNNVNFISGFNEEDFKKVQKKYKKFINPNKF